MNKDEIEKNLAAGNYEPLKLEIQDDGKKGGALKDMPITFRDMFSRSIKRTLVDPSIPKEGDWSVQVTDDQEPGLKYQLHYFRVDGVEEYMVVCRVVTYDMEKKEVLPDDQDKVIVFKFKNVDDLL